jgi:hypothetical protein
MPGQSAGFESISTVVADGNLGIYARLTLGGLSKRERLRFDS